MNCPRCHEPVDVKAAFCPSCGKRLLLRSPDPKKEARKKLIWGIVLGLLALAAAVLGIRKAQAEARRQAVTPGKLAYFTEVTDGAEALLEDYFDAFLQTGGSAADRDLELETAVNLAVREEIFLRQEYERLSGKKGWDPVGCRDYQALYDAYRELYGFFDACIHRRRDFDRAEYDSLLAVYRDCREKLP